MSLSIEEAHALSRLTDNGKEERTFWRTHAACGVACIVVGIALFILGILSCTTFELFSGPKVIISAFVSSAAIVSGTIGGGFYLDWSLHNLNGKLTEEQDVFIKCPKVIPYESYEINL